jgi:uncharacterized protein (TIGR02594 family)
MDNLILKPVWVSTAEAYVGLKEVPGKGNDPTIVKWLVTLKAWWRDDLTPWCGTFCGAVFREVGLKIPAAWYRAKAWLNWGVTLTSPAYGCVVVFNRKGGGHVGFVVGINKDGQLMVLGGNQDNMVSVAPFDRERIAGFRWPADANRVIPNYNLPLLESTGEVSQNEI